MGIRLSGLATKVTQKYSTIGSSWYINPNNSRRMIVLVSQYEIQTIYNAQPVFLLRCMQYYHTNELLYSMSVIVD